MLIEASVTSKVLQLLLLYPWALLKNPIMSLMVRPEAKTQL